jgi:hypothetical protein
MSACGHQSSDQTGAPAFSMKPGRVGNADAAPSQAAMPRTRMVTLTKWKGRKALHSDRGRRSLAAADLAVYRAGAIEFRVLLFVLS